MVSSRERMAKLKDLSNDRHLVMRMLTMKVLITEGYSEHLTMRLKVKQKESTSLAMWKDDLMDSSRQRMTKL